MHGPLVGPEDPVVRRVLNRVATLRIDYLEQSYAALGFPAPSAKAHAVIAYAAYRGVLQLAHEAPGSLPSEWTSYAELTRRTFVPGDGRKRSSPPSR